MPADKQYTDAKRALRVMERQALGPGTYVTYGILAEELGYEPKDYGRHIGQVRKYAWVLVASSRGCSWAENWGLAKWAAPPTPSILLDIKLTR